MSAIQRQRREHEERTEREMARLNRLADERRRDLEERLRHWAEQHQRAAETQNASSAAFIRNFRDSIFVEKDINLPKEKSSQPRSHSSDGKGNKCDKGDRSSHRDPKVTASYPRVPRPEEDLLQAAMR